MLDYIYLIHFVITWWIAPMMFVMAGLHCIYMFYDQTLAVVYDLTAVKETLIISIIWPLGLGIIIFCISLYIHKLGQSFIDRWTK